VSRVRIESIAGGGDGVGHLKDGRVIFVPRTAPGDLAEVRITNRAKRWARGRVERIVEPSPDRREPPCVFADRCGGCALEHLAYPAQLAAKARVIGDALSRIAGIPTEPPEVTASPVTERYRNRVSFTLRRGGAGEVVAGFHDAFDASRIVDVDGRCLLPEEPVARAWDELRAGWGPDARLLPSGAELRLTLRGTNRGDVVLVVEGGGSPGRPEELLERVPRLRSIWHRPGSTEAEPVLLAGEETVAEEWGGRTIELGATAFLQVNRAAAALLEEYAVEQVGPASGIRAVDAYCGVGLYGRRMAAAGARVTGIESDPAAVAVANRGAPEGFEAVEGRVEERLGEALPADVVILNPPRGGLDAEVLALLAATPPARIVYVSCDPATLARDLKRLGAGFRITALRGFDLFPQTAHVETVATLERSSA